MYISHKALQYVITQYNACETMPESSACAIGRRMCEVSHAVILRPCISRAVQSSASFDITGLV